MTKKFKGRKKSEKAAENATRFHVAFFGFIYRQQPRCIGEKSPYFSRTGPHSGKNRFARPYFRYADRQKLRVLCSA